MGSEGPPSVTIHVTGFKKFHGVSENPTETIVSNLKDYVSKKGLPKGLILGSCNILDTAGQGALVPLYQTLQSAVSSKDSESSDYGRVIWVSCSCKYCRIITPPPSYVTVSYKIILDGHMHLT